MPRKPLQVSDELQNRVFELRDQGYTFHDIELEACQKRFTWPYQMTEEQIMELHRYYVALRDIKRYQGTDG